MATTPPEPMIYTAIYSGVPVYEMVCQGVPVMRRMADSYMNATQILKVAKFNKPKRTKIIEREVLMGDHEKIQGGYGKYQGTWIPLNDGRELAQKYQVEQHVRPLLDFDPTTQAVLPKPPSERALLEPSLNVLSGSGSTTPSGDMSPTAFHGIGSSMGSPSNRSDAATVSEDGVTPTEEAAIALPNAAIPQPQSEELMTPMEGGSQATTNQQFPFNIDNFLNSAYGSSALAQQFLTDLYSREPATSSSSLPSSLSYLSGDGSDQAVQSAYHLAMLGLLSAAAQAPYQSLYGNNDSFLNFAALAALGNVGGTVEPKVEEQPPEPVAPAPEPAPTKKDRRRARDSKRSAQTEAELAARRAAEEDQRRRDILMNLYMHGDEHKKDIIKLLMSRTNPEKIEVDLYLDEHGGTALQYAAAWGCISVVKALIHQGADIYAKKRGETALMQAVCSSSNYDLQIFPELLAVLQELVYEVDLEGRTILHYVAELTSVRSKWPAAHYYARCLGEFLNKDRMGGRSRRYKKWLNIGDLHGNTALHIACRNGSRLVAELLLKLGSDQEVVNKAGLTAVDVARCDPYMLRTLSLQGEKDDEALYSDESDFFYSSDEEDDATGCSPSPNPVERSLHLETMQKLGDIYGDTLASILQNLTPTRPVDNELESARLHRELEHVQATQREIEFARAQLQSAKPEFEELKQQRKHFSEMIEYAQQLEMMLKERLGQDSARRGRPQEREHVAGKKRARSGSAEAAVDGTSPGRSALPGSAAARTLFPDQPPATEEPNAQHASPDRHLQPSTTHLATPATSPIMLLNGDGGGSSSSQSDYPPSQPPQPFPLPQPPQFDSTSNDNSEPFPPLTALPGPAITTTAKRQRSNRASESRMRAELQELQEQVAKSERTRARMLKDLEDIRSKRKEKDRKFKKIIAACLGVVVERVDEIVEDLVQGEN